MDPSSRSYKPKWPKQVIITPNKSVTQVFRQQRHLQKLTKNLIICTINESLTLNHLTRAAMARVQHKKWWLLRVPFAGAHCSLRVPAASIVAASAVCPLRVHAASIVAAGACCEYSRCGCMLRVPAASIVAAGARCGCTLRVLACSRSSLSRFSRSSSLSSLSLLVTLLDDTGMSSAPDSCVSESVIISRNSSGIFACFISNTSCRHTRTHQQSASGDRHVGMPNNTLLDRYYRGSTIKMTASGSHPPAEWKNTPTTCI